jgi:hypothetical protein
VTNSSALTNTSGDGCGRRSAAPETFFSATQGSPSLALGLALTAAAQLVGSSGSNAAPAALNHLMFTTVHGLTPAAI